MKNYHRADQDKKVNYGQRGNVKPRKIFFFFCWE